MLLEILNQAWAIAALLAVIVLVPVGIAAVSLLRSLRKESEFRYLKELVGVAVVSSEQLAKSGALPPVGQEKKNVALNSLAEMGVEVDNPEFLEMLIETVVNERTWALDPEEKLDVSEIRATISG